MNSQSGDFGFVYNGKTNLFSRAVAWFMKSQWTHSFNCIGKVDGIPMVLETCDTEVVINRLDRYLDGRPIKLFRIVGVSYEQRQIMKAALYKHLGKPYGFKRFLYMGLRRLLKRIGINIKLRFNDEKVCCDLVFDMLSSIDNPLQLVERGDTEELYQMVLKFPKFFEEVKLETGNKWN